MSSSARLLSSLLLLALTLAATSKSATAQDDFCDPGWTGDASVGSCYSIAHLTDGVNDDAVEWFQAFDYCTGLRPDAFLATIRTSEEQIFVTTALGAAGNTRIWIAGNDLATEGEWEWGFNSGDLVVFTAWRDDEPTNGDQEDCIALTGPEFDYLWRDAECFDLEEALCQYIP